ncbi:histidine phosphatase family protein [Actinophytocola gossypii]|uniref:Histidine phosphatase family protein n=1 Tax=Actinophytocola gossypii TaxID=2812003 RepID=A0ABT2JGV2_9PSEU|nr:histidine phosphatase family protein [Actinophytocola gossypii]MCT2586968.1 histidine phosphatase family protein [Actinophytocola gossypii]
MSEPVEYRQHRFALPPGATEILLVRHGESAPARDGHPFPLVDGHGDPPLAPEGEREAELVGDRLAVERIDALYVTSLRRTHQTAAPLAKRLDLTPRVEADLREVRLGEWEGGLFRIRVSQRHEYALRMWETQRWDAIPGAESTEDLAARVRAAIDRIAAAHPDGHVAAFTHGGVIGQIVAMATGSEPFAFIDADNASITQLVVTPERWIVRRFNDTAHLHPAFSIRPEPLI